MFSRPGDSKLTRDGLGFRSKEKRLNDGTISFERLGGNIAPLYFKTEKVAETALRAS